MSKSGVSLDVQWDVVLQDLWRSGHWILVAGFAIAFADVYAGLMTNEWSSARDGHGPFIQLVSLIFLLLKGPALKALPARPAPIAGWTGLVVSLLVMAVAHSQDVTLLSVSSMIGTLAGLVLIFRGWQGLKLVWFPLFFLVFSVPLPGWLMDGLTQPLKLQLSQWVTNFLFEQGFPIAANGVVIFIGQYQLLVKDACAGLNSMHSLAAVGAFYIYVSRPEGWLHRALLILFILPAAYLANLTRVTALVLITYYFGEGAGQGLLHDLSGLVLFMVALVLFLILDFAIIFCAHQANRIKGWVRQ